MNLIINICFSHYWHHSEVQKFNKQPKLPICYYKQIKLAKVYIEELLNLLSASLWQIQDHNYLLILCLLIENYQLFLKVSDLRFLLVQHCNCVLLLRNIITNIRCTNIKEWSTTVYSGDGCSTETYTIKSVKYWTGDLREICWNLITYILITLIIHFIILL